MKKKKKEKKKNPLIISEDTCRICKHTGTHAVIKRGSAQLCSVGLVPPLNLSERIIKVVQIDVNVRQLAPTSPKSAVLK